MNQRSPRRRLLLAAPLAALAVAVLAGCGAANGLADGDIAPSMSVQPHPEPFWPAWSSPSSDAPAADTATQQPPPKALTGLPKVDDDKIADLDVATILRADPRMKPLADRPSIAGPGRAGLRPPVYADLTGDGKRDLLAAADLESGRSVLAVYTMHDGKVYPILFTSGRRMSIEALDKDILVRSPCPDGGEQAVRYRWNGVRMGTYEDNKTYKKSPENPSAPAPDPKPEADDSEGPRPAPSGNASLAAPPTKSSRGDERSSPPPGPLLIEPTVAPTGQAPLPVPEDEGDGPIDPDGGDLDGTS
ncbi:hypothetical protein [Streptomyces sp. NPDC059009]|uniref:hypothetical protein n=1 Tax=Streptomyces sp. NPDC059009 TaxID=3346694 RepID=UPI0036C7729F